LSLDARYEEFDKAAKDDLSVKGRTLLSFDFEAAVKLMAWDDACALVKVGCGRCPDPFLAYLLMTFAQDVEENADPQSLMVMGDIILSSEAPVESQ
jgi:hypothetical protein